MYAMLDLEMTARLKMTSMEWDVLTQIMSHVNGENNEASITVRQIAANLGVLEPSVSRSLIALRDRRIVFTLRRGVHRVNAHIMFRGSNQDWDIATDTEVEPIWNR